MYVSKVIFGVERKLGFIFFRMYEKTVYALENIIYQLKD